MITEEKKTIIKNMSNQLLNQTFINSCITGNINVVKYLLTSPELKEHADIHTKDDEAIIMSCYHGQLNIVQYLLTSTDLKEHSDIRQKNYEVFRGACSYPHNDILEYLIFNGHIQKNDAIDKYIINHGKNYISCMFEQTILKQKLEHHLQNHEIIHERDYRKIKI